MTFHCRPSCLFDVVVTGRTPDTNLFSPWVGDSKGLCCDSSGYIEPGGSHFSATSGFLKVFC